MATVEKNLIPQYQITSSQQNKYMSQGKDPAWKTFREIMNSVSVAHMHTLEF